MPNVNVFISHNNKRKLLVCPITKVLLMECGRGLTNRFLRRAVSRKNQSARPAEAAKTKGNCAEWRAQCHERLALPEIFRKTVVDRGSLKWLSLCPLIFPAAYRRERRKWRGGDSGRAHAVMVLSYRLLQSGRRYVC